MTEMTRTIGTLLALMLLCTLASSCGGKKTSSPEEKAKLDTDMKANMNKAYGAGGPGAAKSAPGGPQAPTAPK